MGLNFSRRLACLKRETHALYLAACHPRTPWYARLLAAAIVAYAASPIDLIPDFIPVLGYLDDLVLVPLGVWIAVKLIPEEVLVECRAHALQAEGRSRAWGWAAAALIGVLWLAAALLAGLWVREAWQGQSAG